MLGRIFHVGLTVSDLDRSVRFYRDVLGLRYQGEILMEGVETEALFQRRGCRARVAYLNGSDRLDAPPVELIEFEGVEVVRATPDLFSTSISELCFFVDDIEGFHRKMEGKGVECLSAPRTFDFASSGFGRSRAFYFRDPDGIVLEAMQPLDDQPVWDGTRSTRDARSGDRIS